VKPISLSFSTTTSIHHTTHTHHDHKKKCQAQQRGCVDVSVSPSTEEDTESEHLIHTICKGRQSHFSTPKQQRVFVNTVREIKRSTVPVESSRFFCKMQDERTEPQLVNHSIIPTTLSTTGTLLLVPSCKARERKSER